VKSYNEHTGPVQEEDLEFLRNSIKKEKEQLVAMFLANASNMELSEQFKLIDELNNKITNQYDPEI
jgi:hypothetical protein